MRVIDYRRHAPRDPGAIHLNARGRAIALRIGAVSGPYARVVTSPVPRAVETAEAMGFPVTEQRAELATWGAGVEAALGPIVEWADYDRSLRRSATVARFADLQRSVLLGIARSVPDGAKALVISHGGVLELGAVAALPEADHRAWGRTAGYCEGIQLTYDGLRFVTGEPLRVDAEG